MYYVYIIRSEKNGKLYRGSTSNLRQRIKEHNAGSSKYTKGGIPWELLYYEVFADKTDALREEIFLKSGKGKERIKYLLTNTLKIKHGGFA